MTAPRFPLQGDPFALRGVDPRMAQFMSLAEDPAAAVVASAPSRDSILFPRQPSAGILTPDDQAMIKRNTLLQIAAGLLQAGGRSPNQRGTLANIGSALAGIDLPGATMSAMRMRAITDRLNQEGEARHAFEEIARRYPPMPGETREERFNRLSNIVGELALVPGAADLIGKLSNVLAQLKPEGEATDWSSPTPAVGPDGKTTSYYQVNRRTGETRQLNIRPPAARGRPQLRVVAGPNGPEYATIDPVTGDAEMTGQPASLTEAQQRVNALYGLVQDANQFLETQLSPSRVQYLVQTNGLNEFLKNNAEELEQASTQVADAYVRLTSGAAAREEEYVRARRLLTPYPGDDQKTLERKIAARNRMLTAIRRGAGITDGGTGPKGRVPQQPGNPFRKATGTP